MNDFARIEVEYDDQEYISEFDFESIKRALEMGIMDKLDDMFSFTKILFYCSVLKNHPFANKRKTDEFVEMVIQDEEYGLDAFTEISDAFYEGFMRYKGGKGKEKKVFSAKKEPVRNVPKASK